MNVVPYLQRLLTLVLSIVLPGEELAQGEREGRIGDATRAAIRRFLVEQALTVPDGLEEQSPAWFEWLIRKLEATERSEFVVVGQIRDTAQHPLSNVKVQAFDRELPSRERRTGSAPQKLGEEATTDAEGRFRITYTLDQFRAADAFSRTRRLQAQRADISFLVFDQTGQELKIRRTEAPNREVGRDQIIYNAPSELLDVNLVVDPPQQPGDSEYERLVAEIAPVIEGVLLTELTDEDVAFLVNELELELPREVQQQRVEWLRRSSLLAQDTQLPAEALYGWGRKDMPAGLAELAAVRLSEMPKVLEKLASLSGEGLRNGLLAAIEENIIAASFRTRVDETVRQLTRRVQVLRSVISQLQDEETKEPLADYTVTTYDKDTGDENRGLDITDSEGKFLFDFYVPRQIPPDAATRRFSFQVLTPQGEAIPQGEPTVIDLNRSESEIVPVRIRVPKPQVPPLEEQLRQIQIQVPPEMLEWLRVQEIHTFADIRRRGGRIQSDDLPQIDPVIIRQLEALADLDRVTSAAQVSEVLLDKGYDSVLAINDAPYTEFISVVTGEQATLTALEVAKLHVMATVQTSLLNNILTALAADTANGFNL